VTIVADSFVAQPKKPELYSKQKLKETCLE